MTFAQQWNHLTAHFSERISFVKRHMTVLTLPYTTCEGFQDCKLSVHIISTSGTLQLPSYKNYDHVVSVNTHAQQSSSDLCVWTRADTRILYFEISNNLFSIIFAWGKWCTIASGTVLQARRSQVRLPTVSLEFFIDIILPSAPWPRGWHRFQQKWITRISLGGKGSQCVGPTTLPPSSAKCLEIWEPQTPGNLLASNRPIQGTLYLYL